MIPGEVIAVRVRDCPPPDVQPGLGHVADCRPVPGRQLQRQDAAGHAAGHNTVQGDPRSGAGGIAHTQQIIRDGRAHILVKDYLE